MSLSVLTIPVFLNVHVSRLVILDQLNQFCKVLLLQQLKLFRELMHVNLPKSAPKDVIVSVPRSLLSYQSLKLRAKRETQNGGVLTLSPHSSPETAALLSNTLSSSELSSLTRFDFSFAGASRRRFGFDDVAPSTLSTLDSRSEEGLARDFNNFKKLAFASDLNVYLVFRVIRKNELLASHFVTCWNICRRSISMVF